MKLSRFLPLFALAGALVLAGATGARTDALTPREEALHVLNRLGFGPRPGDVERVLAMGPAKWAAAQLHPERIPDAAVEARLAHLETLTLSNAELIARFETPLREAKKKLEAERAAREKNDGEPGAADRMALRALIPPESRPRRVLDELTAARILRGAESERQLNEVMVDFWMNHFNVYANKGTGRVAIASFERDTIGPRIWGKFEDLLLATAASPAMLAYLDNARSVADEAHRPAGKARREAVPNAKAPRGLNENYARELLELHTLGVDGGYSQADVTELARILTGWSIALPRGGVEKSPLRRRAETAEPGSFVFRARLHDAGRKTLLGSTFPAGGGLEEGERAIRLLAGQPATARHIAQLLCQRLVADEPPPPLVVRVALRFEATGGDLRETVRAIVESPEFFDPRYYRTKVKSPFEYAVSAVRAGGGSTDGRAIAKQIAEMGQPLYLCQPPTGYADTAEAWVNSGALLARLNFAIALAEGRIPGTSAGPAAASRAPAQELGKALAGSELSAETLQTIRARTGDAGPAALTTGLVLGSPEFQKQ